MNNPYFTWEIVAIKSLRNKLVAILSKLIYSGRSDKRISKIKNEIRLLDEAEDYVWGRTPKEACESDYKYTDNDNTKGKC